MPPRTVPQRCDPSIRRCTPTVNCCVPGFECEPRLPSDCPEQGCAADDECPGEQTCAASTCVEPVRCVADVDCFGDRYCDEGSCTDGCTEDADCSGADTCVDQRCERNESCFADADCTDGRFVWRRVAQMGVPKPLTAVRMKSVMLHLGVVSLMLNAVAMWIVERMRFVLWRARVERAVDR